MMRGIEMRERVMQCERGGGVFTFIQKGKAKLDRKATYLERSKRSNEQGSKSEKFIEREVKNE